MNSLKLDHLAQKTIIYSFYALFFLVPLILTPFNYELFEFNKMLTVYIATIIITAAWLIRIIVTRTILITRTPFDIPLLLFLLSQSLATIFSINLHTSVFGYYSRFHGSLLSTISYIILYYAAVSHLNRQHILNTLYIILTTAALVAAYGIAEHFGIDKILWVQDVQTRVFSTLGQPNWLAAYLVTIIFIPIAFTLHVHPRGVHRTIAYCLVAIYYLTLLYTKSRSGLLGFAIAYLLFWLLTHVRSILTRILTRVVFPWKQFLILSFTLLTLSLVDTLRWIPQVNSVWMKWDQSTSGVALDSPWVVDEVKTSPAVAGGTQLESGGSESGDIRRIVWQGAIKVWRHWPIFGSGVETFAYSYYNFRPPEHNLVSEWDFLYNKAHNEYLNFLATTGIIGLGAYLLLQIWVFIWLLKQGFNQRLKTKDQTLLLAFISGLAGLSISNFFGFSTVPVALLFFLYPAFAIVLTRHETKT